MLRTRHLRFAIRSLLILVAAGFVLIGCQARQVPRPNYQAVIPTIDADLEVAVLKGRTREFYRTTAGQIERAADRIVVESDDPAVKHRARKWKATAIPEFRSAAFRRDPVGAVIDSWYLSLQMYQFFTSREERAPGVLEAAPDGGGAQAFGAQQIYAREVSRLVLENIEWHLAFHMSGATDEERTEQVLAFRNDVIGPLIVQRSYFLEDMSFTRTSVIGLLVGLTDRQTLGTLATVKSLGETFDDLYEQLTVMNTSLPQDIRWQTEMVLADTLGEEGLDDISGSLAGIDRGANRAVTVAEDIADLIPAVQDTVVDTVATERGIILDAVADERGVSLDAVDTHVQTVRGDVDGQVGRVLDAVDGETAEILDTVRGERAAILDDVERQRLETLERVAAERAIILDEVRAIVATERAAATDDIAVIADDVLRGTEDTAIDAIDHVFLRIIQLGVAALILIPPLLRLYIRILRF